MRWKIVMLVVSSVSSLAAVALAASMSFTANVMPVATGTPSHAENTARIVNSQSSRVASTRVHGGASETRNGGMGNCPVGAMHRHREGLPSMTDSSEGEVSAFR